MAVHDELVLWFNDIEDGFNVSRFDRRGEIPAHEYWCNQDEIAWALDRLRAEASGGRGPPEPIPPEECT